MNFKTGMVMLSVLLWGVVSAGWEAETIQPQRWRKNSSGDMTVAADPAEKAVRFETTFKPGADAWLYPEFQLKEGESLAGTGVIRFEIKAETEGKPKFSCLMIGGKMLAFPAPGAEWRTVEVPIAVDGVDLAAARLLRIGFNPAGNGKSTLWLRNITTVPETVVKARAASALPVFAAVESAAPANVFLDREPVQFTLTEKFRAPCRYQVADVFGTRVAAGDWPENGVGPLRLDGLARGYYTLSLTADDREFNEPLSFAVVAEPAAKPNQESFFAMDTAQSWLSGANSGNTRFPQDSCELVSELCRRAGFGMVRDRIAWAETEKTPGAFQWGKYLRNAELLSERGIAVCGLYHDSAPWAKDGTGKMPADLLAVYNYSKKLAETYRGKMKAWEFWNEPDGNSSDPAWNLAAATKAAYLGFKAGDPNLPMLNASFCVFPLRPYVHAMLGNDAAEYFDIFNYHIYNNLEEYPAIISHLRDTLREYGIDNMPIWITENGTRAEGNGTVQSYRPGLMSHSPAQELTVAEFVPKSQILLQSLGVARDFFFVLTAYNEGEGRKDWGLLRQDKTIKPGYVAFANLNDRLANARYLGSCDFGAGIRAFLYEQPDRRQTLVFWSESDLDRKGADGAEREFSIAQPAGEYPLYTTFGAVSQVKSADGRIALTAKRMPEFLVGLSGLSVTAAAPERGVSGARESGRDLTVVMRAELSDAFQVAQGKESAELLTPSGKLTLQLYNLSPAEKSGTLAVKGANVTGMPDKVMLKPFEKLEIPLEVTLNLPEKEFRTTLEFSGELNGKPISRLAIPLVQTGELLKQGDLLKLDSNNVAQWRANASGQMEIAYDEAEQAIRFRTKFNPGSDRWIYPEYLLKLPAESLENAAGISFEIKAKPEDAKLGFNYTGMMAVLDTVQEHGKAYWMLFPPTTGEWQHRVVMFGGFNPADIRMLRIGMNPKCDDFTYYVRNMRIFHHKPENEKK